MAQPTNTFDTYDAVGIREDLSDVVKNISPWETPFYSGIRSGEKANSTLVEWEVDELSSVDASNQVIEGDEATLDAISAPSKFNNRTQIFDKTAVVSGTSQAVVSAGGTVKMAYQIVKKTKELKRDIETRLLSNNVRVTGNATTARELSGYECWITNGVIGTAGSPALPTGDGSDAPTDASSGVVFTEARLKAVLALCYDDGGMPDSVYMGSFNKQVASGFTGHSSRTDKGEDKKLVAAIDVYVSDWGELKFVNSRFCRSRTVPVIQMDMWEIRALRPTRNWALAKTGDSDKRQILCELTLCALAPKSSGAVFDCTTS